MNGSLLILGRQPALGLAELEGLYGVKSLRPVGTQAAMLDLDAGSVNFSRLGGSIKLTKALDSIVTTKWPEVQKHIEHLIPALCKNFPQGKVTIGISAYDLNVRPQQLQAAGLTIKKILRNDGRPVRLVPNQEPFLNSAQVIHNKLTSDNGIEIVLVRDGAKTIVAQTVAEQDIESYTLRDRGRPKRDARVGMLPPKLAQIIINLAGKHVLPRNAKVDPNHPANRNPSAARLLDPFCGTGVILQEAMLLGYDVYGTDLEPRIIEYSRSNIDWFREKMSNTRKSDLTIGDATQFQWEQPIDLIASETYLGQPFSALPSPEKLEQVRGTCNAIIEKFLKNISNQIKPGTRLCIAVPAWKDSMTEDRSPMSYWRPRTSDFENRPSRFIHLPLIDHLEELGYNRVSFEHVRHNQLLYYRKDQVVARELLVLRRD